MKYLFIIGTQHHLVQLNAAIAHFNIPVESTILIFINNVGEDISSKLEIYNHLSCVKIFKNWVFKDLIANRSKHTDFIEFIKNLKTQDNHFTVFSTVSYETSLLVKAILNVDKIFLMDDGLGHFTNYYFYQSPKRYLYILKLLVKSMLYGRYLNFNTEFIYFTEHEFIIRNAERAVKYKIEKQNNPLEEFTTDEVIFLGTSLVESKLITYENYMKSLKKVREIFQHQKILYFPHRNESASLLSDIESWGFVINKIDEPFESFFSKLNTCPSIISSFHTTAVIQNIAMRFNKLPSLKVFKIDDKLLLRYQKEYDAIFQQMKHIQEIEIMDINNNYSHNSI